MKEDLITNPSQLPDSPKSIAQEHGREEIKDSEKQEIGPAIPHEDLKEAQPQQVADDMNEPDATVDITRNEEISKEAMLNDVNEEQDSVDFASTPRIHESVLHDVSVADEKEEAIISNETSNENSIDNHPELNSNHEPNSQDERLDSVFQPVSIEDSKETHKASDSESIKDSQNLVLQEIAIVPSDLEDTSTSAPDHLTEGSDAEYIDKTTATDAVVLEQINHSSSNLGKSLPSDSIDGDTNSTENKYVESYNQTSPQDEGGVVEDQLLLSETENQVEQSGDDNGIEEKDTEINETTGTEILNGVMSLQESDEMDKVSVDFKNESREVGHEENDAKLSDEQEHLQPMEVTNATVSTMNLVDPILEETPETSNLGDTVDNISSDDKESKAISTSLESNESNLVQTADGDHDGGVTTVNAVFNMTSTDDDDASLTTNATNMSEVGSHIRIKMRHIERKKAAFDLSKRASTPSLNSSRTFGQSSFNISVLSFDSSPLSTSATKNVKDSSIPTQPTVFDVADFVQPRKTMVESMSSKQDRLDYDWCDDIENDDDQDLVDRLLKDKYELGTNLGGGKVYSVVKEAISKQGLGTFAAKIVYKPNSLYRQQKRIDNEVNLLKELIHDNILQVSEVFDKGDCFVMISEYLSGGTLLDRILEKKCLKEDSARKAMKHLLSAIQHCHSLKVVHRDLRLENIMLTSPDDDSHVKLIDFGFATIAESAKCLLTQCGSPQFVAPEILHGKPYGSKVDMWSLGVVCYCMLAGFPPFIGSSQRSLMRHIKKGEFIFHDDYWGGISNEAKEFIKTLLNVNPDDRYDAEQALRHPWILLAETGGEKSTFEHANFEKTLTLGTNEDEIIPSLQAILLDMNNDPQKVVEAMLENNLFEQVVELSLESIFPVKKQAILTIATAVSNGNQSQIHSMVDKGCVEPMSKFLSSSDESVVNACVHGLHNVLKAVSDHDEVKETQVKEQMIRLRTLSKFRHMRRLASNDDIPDVCAHIVDTYFE